MSDYYSILGLTKEASDIEIKAAFRKLAKVYHPDKNPHNPDAKILFENILKAYNTLINSHSRRRYDTSFSSTNVSTTSSQKTKPSRGKEWTFTEEELKRRQYYQNHYKAKQKTASQQKPVTRHSDYKYVLFATPLAVGLLMLLISMFTDIPKSNPGDIRPPNRQQNNTPVFTLSNGDKPYAGYYKNIQTYPTKNTLTLHNTSHYDAIITVFDKETDAYIQHVYILPGYEVEFPSLPTSGVYWKCMLGMNWNKDTLLQNHTVSGGFAHTVQYQNWKKKPIVFQNDSAQVFQDIEVIDPASKNKRYLSNESVFFEKKGQP